MPWLLELAMGISLGLSHFIEGTIIFVLLTMNAIIGQIHSGSSRKVIELLKKKLAITAKVLRNKKWSEEDAKGIVPGDIISVKLGDIVPADARCITGELSIDQSALTGESLPLETKPSDIINAGSIIRRGEATCIGASILVSVSGLLMHLSYLIMLTFVIVVLLGAIPAALPAVLTIVQTIGAKELAKKKALITRLDSVEDDLNDLKLIGLLPLADPPRPDSKSLIEHTRNLGIKPMMLTETALK